MWSEDAPWEAREWLGEHISETDANKLAISWDMGSQRIVLPVWASVARDHVSGDLQCVGPLRGYQLRRTFGTKGPKYLSVRGEQPLETILFPMAGDMVRPAVVVVEDFLSAWAIAHNYNVAVVPLLGVHLPPERLAKLVKEYQRVVVWLDNDSPAVRHRADHIVRLARAFGATACWVGCAQAKSIMSSDVISAVSNALRELD